MSHQIKSCENDEDHSSDNYCRHCSTCMECLEEESILAENRESSMKEQIKRLEDEIANLKSKPYNRSK